MEKQQTGVKPAPSCLDTWIEGDTPDTPKGSSTEFWATVRRNNKNTYVIKLWYMNGHVMPVADGEDPPECTVPHAPDEDGYCEEYEWTCWTKGYCEYCETEWVYDPDNVEIIAHMPILTPAPYQPKIPTFGTPRKPVPGWQYAVCKDCGTHWKETTRDILSPSHVDCPNHCDHGGDTHVMQTSRAELPTDGSGNLIGYTCEILPGPPELKHDNK